MLTICRRHSRKCRDTKKIPIHEMNKCSCPLVLLGTDNFGRYHDREALETRELSVALEALGRVQRGESTPLPPPVMSVREALESYRSILLTQRKLKAETVEFGFDIVMRSMIKYTKEHGITDIHKLKSESIDGWIAKWNVAPNTTRNRINTLKDFLKTAYSRGWIVKNLADLIETPRTVQEGGGTAPFDLELEDQRIMEAAWGWEKHNWHPQGVRSSVWYRKPRTATALILLLRYCGLRFSDAARFRPERLVKRTFEGEEFYCLEAMRQKKTDHPLFLPLERVVAEAIVSAPRVSKEWVFWDGETNIRNWNSRFLVAVLTPLERASGVNDIHPHRFRDTFAVELLSKRADIRSVSRLLGHKNSSTTLRYYEHWVKEDQERLMGTIIAARGKGRVIEFPGRTA